MESCKQIQGTATAYPLRCEIEGLSPEETLYLLLSRKTFLPVFPDEYCKALFNEVRRRSGWKRVVELALQHGVYPILCYHLLRLQPEGVPNETLWYLRAITHHNERSSQAFIKELCRMLDRFHEHGVRAVPYKGVVLAQELYGDPSLKVVGDIDLIIPKAEVLPAVRLLKELGYSGSGEDEAFYERFTLSSSNQIIMARELPDISFAIDIHYDPIACKLGIAALPETFWDEGLVEKQLFGRSVLSTRYEWTLLFLAIHSMKHRFTQFKGLVDLNELCLRPEVDWDVVEEIASRHEWTEVLELALTVCRHTFGTEIPGVFRLDRLPSWVRLFPSPLDRSVFRHFSGPKRLHYFKCFLLRPGWLDYHFFPLPPRLYFMYYFVCPLRIGVSALYRIITTGPRVLAKCLSACKS